MASLNTSELLFNMLFFKKFTDYTGTNFVNVFAPSTVAEGNPNEIWAGADLVIDDYIFQLKMSEQMIGHNAGKRASFNNQEYFEFKVKNNPNKKNACQLDLLKALCTSFPRKDVFYAAPFFLHQYSRNKGNNFWFTAFANSNPNDINNFVAFIDINSIPNRVIQRNNHHKICYNEQSKNNGYAYYFSDLVRIKFKSAKEFKKVNKKSICKDSSWEKLNHRYSSLSSTINGFREILLEQDNGFENEKMSDLEVVLYLANEHELFWMPRLLSHKFYIENH